MVYPIIGNSRIADNYGDFRKGPPPHSHKGNDIYAETGTILVAVEAGTVTRRSGGLGGLAIWLKGTPSGNTYYYAHLDSFSVKNNQKVSEGQVIGQVGNSGNARGGKPHLHFEIHPKGGRAVDPYKILSNLKSGFLANAGKEEPVKPIGFTDPLIDSVTGEIPNYLQNYVINPLKESLLFVILAVVGIMLIGISFYKVKG